MNSGEINLSIIQSANEQRNSWEKNNGTNEKVVILNSNSFCVNVHLYMFMCLHKLKIHNSFLFNIPFVAVM